MSRGAHAYDSLAGASRALGEGALLIDEGLCLNLRGRQALCGACSDGCASAALTLTPDEIALDESRCSACGACLPVCPTGALRLSGFVPRRFVESLQGHETVHLHCSRSRDGGGGVVIPCHRVLDARLLAAGAARGTQRFLLHGLDQCTECERGDARSAVQTIGSTLAEWLNEQAPEVRAAADGEAEAGTRTRQDQVAMSRRNFLRMAGARSALNAAQWFAPVAVEDDEEAELLPFYQGDGELRRPAAYQALLAEQALHLHWRPHTLPWRARRIDTACTGCRTCATRCPSGALALESTATHPEPNGTRPVGASEGAMSGVGDATEGIAASAAPTGAGAKLAITFRLDLCTGCDLCATLCPVEAIRPQPVSGPDLLGEPHHVLIEHAQIRCRQCGHDYIGADDDSGALCFTCRNEQEIDSDWLAMIGPVHTSRIGAVAPETTPIKARGEKFGHSK